MIEKFKKGDKVKISDARSFWGEYKKGDKAVVLDAANESSIKLKMYDGDIQYARYFQITKLKTRRKK